jgi:hypothetical protein
MTNFANYSGKFLRQSHAPSPPVILYSLPVTGSNYRFVYVSAGVRDLDLNMFKRRLDKAMKSNFLQSSLYCSDNFLWKP